MKEIANDGTLTRSMLTRRMGGKGVLVAWLKHLMKKMWALVAELVNYAVFVSPWIGSW